jgi:phosphoglycerol transferase MdoB-like AlkP superfamily enzyme
MQLTKSQRGSSIPYFIRFLTIIYLIGLSIFTLLRLVLILHTAPNSIFLFDPITLKSFAIGFQFDSVILAYILALPLILLFFQTLFLIKGKWLLRFVVVYLSLFFPVLFFIAIADIPYFKFFSNRLSEASFQWLGSLDVVFKMIVGNQENFIFLIISILATGFSVYFFYSFTHRKLVGINWDEQRENTKLKFLNGYFALAIILCFLGMRGSIMRPIRQGDAFYSNNPYLNQIGLNAAYSIMKSYVTKVKLMDNEIALKNTQELLRIENPLTNISPIARLVQTDSTMRKPNIVLVLMESMSANYMSTFGNPNNLTPNLDSLTKQSWFFENAYSAGIHTNNGVFSSLFSFPALKRIRPMSTVPINTYSGLPFTLKKNGYKNYFFSTHNENFDNLSVFIPQNFYDDLFTAEDFPSDKIVGPYGVPDDYLFTYASQKFSEFNSNTPFFATILTTSNHDPYILPDYYKNSHSEKDLNAVSYADWSIGNFLKEAKKAPWFDNTIFIFVSDHGLKVGNNPYDLPLSYHHIPIIFYSPKLLPEPIVYPNFIGQIDIFPTLMGVLNASYINNTLGVNVLKDKRDCIYFSADDKIGCLDENWLYIYRFGGNEGLYKYKDGDLTDYSQTNKNEFEKLRKYALSQTQTADYIISGNKAQIPLP